jgi:deoxyribodipyrimidine photo-lyase
MAPGDALKPAATAIFWFRRDLRLEDNSALAAALQSGFQVQPIFIFDPNILGKLKLRDDRRVTFIHNTLAQLDKEIRKRGGALRVFHGKPPEVFRALLRELKPRTVYCNEDYEPYARERDAAVQGLCPGRGAKG